MQDLWSPCGKAILKFRGFVVLPGRHILYRVGLENVNHLSQWTHNSRRTLGIFFKTQLSSSFFWGGGSLKTSVGSSLGLSLFSKKLSGDACFSLILARVSLWAYQNHAWDSVQRRKEAQTKVGNKITGRPCVDSDLKPATRSSLSLATHW